MLTLNVVTLLKERVHMWLSLRKFKMHDVGNNTKHSYPGTREHILIFMWCDTNFQILKKYLMVKNSILE